MPRLPSMSVKFAAPQKPPEASPLHERRGMAGLGLAQQQHTGAYKASSASVTAADSELEPRDEIARPPQPQPEPPPDRNDPSESRSAAPAPQAIPDSSSKNMRYGERLERDPRIAHIVEREKFLLSVIMPRVRTLNDALREWGRRSFSRTVLRNVGVVLALQLSACIACASGLGGGVCAVGPIAHPASNSADGVATGLGSSASDDDDWQTSLSEIGPPMINALSILMLSFYANVRPLAL